MLSRESRDVEILEILLLSKVSAELVARQACTAFSIGLKRELDRGHRMSLY